MNYSYLSPQLDVITITDSFEIWWNYDKSMIAKRSEKSNKIFERAVSKSGIAYCIVSTL